jgi:hypothetical protein
VARGQGLFDQVVRQHVAEHPQSTWLQWKAAEDPLGRRPVRQWHHPHAASRISADLGMGRVPSERCGDPVHDGHGGPASWVTV